MTTSSICRYLPMPMHPFDLDISIPHKEYKNFQQAAWFYKLAVFDRTNSLKTVVRFLARRLPKKPGRGLLKRLQLKNPRHDRKTRKMVL